MTTNPWVAADKARAAANDAVAKAQELVEKAVALEQAAAESVAERPAAEDDA